MKHSNYKGNPNLLYNDFKSIEEYDPQDNFQLNFRKSPAYKKKNELISSAKNATKFINLVSFLLIPLIFFFFSPTMTRFSKTSPWKSKSNL